MSKDRKQEWSSTFRKLFQDFPEDHQAALTLAEKIAHSFHQELAVCMGPVITSQLSQMPQDTYAERQAIASLCNNILQKLHLKIRCPNTQLAGILVADIASQGDSVGRFRIEVKTESGKTTRSFSSRQFPELELVEAPPRTENFSHYRHGK